MPELSALLLRFQRELFVVGAELAANPTARERLEEGVTKVSEAMLTGVEDGARALGIGGRAAARVRGAR